MTNYTPFKKLIKGAVLFFLFWILNHFLGANQLSHYEHVYESRMSEVMNKNLAAIICNLAMVFVGIFMVYCFVSGIYRICTFNHYVREFEDKTPGGVPVKGHSSYPNINRILDYRESKMAGMSPDRAAELYVSSSKIESLYTGYTSGPETQRVLSYIESKLSGMSPERGLNYLANKL